MNYFIGQDRTRWRSNVPQYGRLRYRHVYPGIDLVFHGEEARLEYDFVVSPGADPGAIRVTFRGAGALSLNDNGELVDSGIVLQPRPVAYQLHGDLRTSLDCQYRIAGKNAIRFSLGSYDRSLPLVIDPVLVYATFLAGPNDDADVAPRIAVDQAGFVYITGSTQSAQFPRTTGSYDSRYHGNRDIFVAKLNPDGTRLIYGTYLGGGQRDAANGLAIDSGGSAYIVGQTSSPDFPVTAGASQTRFGGEDFENGGDAFVAKLDPTGAKLVYATFLGGSNADEARGVAVDQLGNTYVAGWTRSADFPIASQVAQPKYSGASAVGPRTGDAFVSKLNPTGSALVYSTYLGGTGDDVAYGIALDGANNAYVTGSTASVDFPSTADAYQPALHSANPYLGREDVFVAKLDALGSRLVYATYLGGSGGDFAYAIAVDRAGSAYVTGGTNSPEFPTTPGAFQKAYRGSYKGFAAPTNAFVTKVNPTGTALTYSTYLGGSGWASAYSAVGDSGSSIAVDGLGRAYVAGITYSGDFPTANPIQSGQSPVLSVPGWSGFIAEFDASASSLLFGTFLGGLRYKPGQGDFVAGIATDGSGRIYVTGLTESADFPATPGSLQTTVTMRLTPYGSFTTPVTFIAKLDPLAPPQTAAANVVNSASYLAGPVAPGEFISIFGVGLGQVHGVAAQLSPSGTLQTTIGGTTVTFDGVAAPLLYADANQINAIVPYSVTGTTQMQVTFQNTTSAKIALPVAPTAPGIFLLSGSTPNQGLIVNEDGTLNSPSNPAARKSVVVFYAIGAGAMVPAQQDGTITPLTPPWPKPALAPLVTIGGIPAKLGYAGAAPGLVAGVLQINAEVPDGSPTGSAVPMSLAIGASTAQVNMAVR